MIYTDVYEVPKMNILELPCLSRKLIFVVVVEIDMVLAM